MHTPRQLNLLLALLLCVAACEDDANTTADDASTEDTEARDTGSSDDTTTTAEDTADDTTEDTAQGDTRAEDTTAADTSGDAAEDTAPETRVEDTTSDTIEPPAEVLAFPGAEGFGARATGGRGGAVLKVTHLGSSGEGSLSWAVAQEGPRIVVFEVSGVIEGDVTIPHGDLTIAGQTAPCGGITLNGSLRSTYGEPMSNIIIRHLRVSPPTPAAEDCANHDAIQFSTVSRIILDHVDASHAGDEIIDLWGGAHDVTVQWSSIVFPIADSTCDHPKGLINHRPCADSGGCTEEDFRGGRISVHHNLFAHCHNRTPALSTGPADAINNVIYNGREGFVHHNIVGAHDTDPSATGDFNIIGNTYIEGPSAALSPLWLDPENGTETIPTRYHVDDNNVLEDASFSGVFNDPWTTPGYADAYTFACCGVDPSQSVGAPFDFSSDPAYVPLTIHPHADAHDRVLAEAGAWPRDIITRTALQELQTRSGSQRDFVPGDLFDGLTPCDPPADRDDDGLPDDWESARGLDPDAPDADTLMESGYTAIEDYINARADAVTGAE